MLAYSILLRHQSVRWTFFFSIICREGEGKFLMHFAILADLTSVVEFS